MWGQGGRGRGSFLVSGAGQGDLWSVQTAIGGGDRVATVKILGPRNRNNHFRILSGHFCIDVTDNILVTILASCDREKCVSVSVGGTGAG